MVERNLEKNIALFQEEKPSLESYWRSVVLFGQNTASYKFSLAESLMDLAKQGKTIITLKDLAIPYSKHICRHIAKEERQATNASSTFLEACSAFTRNKISNDELLNKTVKNGFTYVLDCFHKVNGADLPVKFYEKEGKRLILTDEIFKIINIENAVNLYQENESRWNLVETAWKLNISPDRFRILFQETTLPFQCRRCANPSTAARQQGPDTHTSGQGTFAPLSQGLDSAVCHPSGKLLCISPSCYSSFSVQTM